MRRHPPVESAASSGVARYRGGGDVVPVLLACAAVAGALHPVAWPLVPGAALVILGLGARRPLPLIVGVALLASAFGARSLAGLASPPRGRVDATVTLVTDPERGLGATRAVARLGRRRVEVDAGGAAGDRLSRSLAGRRVRVTGTIGPLDRRAADRLAAQHVAARVDADDVRPRGDGDALSGAANAFRQRLVAGTASLSPARRALFLGIVLGDDRDQDPAEVEDFRASGLTHLLAVSGQNVAFALAVASPLLSRLSLRGRLVGALGVLVFFGVLTRWQPSVLRAEAMAALTLLAAAAGRPASTVRVLALSVTALVLVDPLLVRSLGFRLSVAACAGLAVLSGPLTRRMPAPLAVTLAAQAGVAPVMVPAFGAMPLAAIPANLLAVPVAGPLMMWGLTAGFVAGLGPAPIARVLHLPTRLMLGWLSAVARVCASLPVGRVGLVPLALVAVTIAAAFAVRGASPRAGPGAARRIDTIACAVAAACVAVIAIVVALPRAHDRSAEPVAGGRLWTRRGSVVVVAANPDGARLLADLRAKGIHGIDVLVVTAPGHSTATRMAPLLGRIHVRLTLAPARTPVPNALAATAGTVVTAGALEIEILRSGTPLGVRVGSAGAAGVG